VIVNVVVVLEDTQGRVDRMREVLELPLVVFARVPDLLAWMGVGENAARAALVTLDYHLARRADGNGLEAALGLAQLAPVCPVIVHSSDVTGAAGAARVLSEGGWTVSCAPFESGRWERTAARLLNPGGEE
jgi:hypothetical protein